MILLWSVLAVALLLAAGYFSGAEMGLYSLNRLRLRLRAERDNDAAARALLELSDRRERSVLALLLTQNLLNYLLTVVTVGLIARAAGVSSDAAEVYAAIILSPVVFVFGDVVPKNWFHAHANRLMYPTVRVVQACVLVLRYTGVVWVLESLTRWLAELSGPSEVETWRGARGEVIGLLRESAAASTGPITEEQARMIERVMNLANVRVGSIMIPRRHVVALPAAADRKLLEQVVQGHDFSRLPLLAADRRSAAGVVNVYDVLGDEVGRPIQDYAVTPVEIQASDSAPQALLKLRQAHQSMGIVVDPRRGFVGVVTLKDLVEEIFGELAAW